MSNIRSFRNADVPALADVWTRHWAILDEPPNVSAARIEQAILARTFFDPADLLVCESDSGITAWSHLLWDPSNADTAVIGAICLVPGAEDVGPPLLAETLARVHQRGISQVQAGVIRDDRFGYAGLEPIGHGMGIFDSDQRLQALLSSAGFSPLRQAVSLSVSTRNYRPPVSREAMQLRRSTRIDATFHRASDLRTASAKSHVDVRRHRLLDARGDVLAEIDLWHSDPEAEVMRPNLLILDLSQPHQRERLEPAEAYLISATLQAMSTHGGFEVETVVDSDQPVMGEQLMMLRFQIQGQGQIWARSEA